jgi:hypothetical protein
METHMRSLFLFSFAVLLLPATGVVRAQGDPKAIVEKAIRAHGGEAKLAKLNATQAKSKGTMEMMGQTLPFTSTATGQLPDKMREEVTLERMGRKLTILQILNGDKGWASLQGQTQELTGALLEEAKDAAYSGRVESLTPLLKEQGFTLTAIPDATVNGKPAAGVKVASKGHKDISLYFDKEKGLLVRSARKSLDNLSMADVTMETNYSDFKDIDGVMTPMKMQVQKDGKPFMSGELLEVKYLDKVDEKLFEKP